MPRTIVSDVLREGLYTRVLGRHILYFRSLASTMDEAARLAREGAEEGTVVVAEEQTSSRGRFQRPWVSELGNLYFSVCFRPSTEALRYLSILAGVAVERAIRKITGLKPTIKWPNDVRLRGKKVCGILVENAFEGAELRYAILGIGINVSLDPSTVDGLSEIATGLNVETGKEVNRVAILRSLLHELDTLYATVNGAARGTTSRHAPGTPSADGVLDEWRGLLETLGTRVEVRWQGEVYSGHAEDVDSLGNLVLRQEDGTTKTLPAGEVTSQQRRG